MKKLNKKNIVRFAIMMIGLSIVVHDLYVLLIQPIFTSYLASWTIFGIITFMFALFVAVNMAEKLKLL